MLRRPEDFKSKTYFNPKKYNFFSQVAEIEIQNMVSGLKFTNIKYLLS